MQWQIGMCTFSDTLDLQVRLDLHMTCSSFSNQRTTLCLKPAGFG
jgi:hypothetical protein